MSDLRIPKNFDAAIIALQCPRPHCTHKFTHSGEEYRTVRALACPECGGEIQVDLGYLKKLHEMQLKMLRQARARMRTLGI